MKLTVANIVAGLCFLVLSLQFEGLMADENGYQLPPQEVVDIIDAKPEPIVSFSPDANWMVLIDFDAMPDIADISRRMLELAGLRVDPVANSGFSTSFYHGITLRPADVLGAPKRRKSS